MLGAGFRVEKARWIDRCDRRGTSVNAPKPPFPTPYHAERTRFLSALASAALRPASIPSL